MPEVMIEAEKYIGRMPHVPEFKKFFQRNGNSAEEFIWNIKTEESPYNISVTVLLNEDDTLAVVRPTKLKLLSDMGRCLFESVNITAREQKYICSVLDVCFPEACSKGEKLYGAPKNERAKGHIYELFNLSEREINENEIAAAESFFCDFYDSVLNDKYILSPGDVVYYASVLQARKDICVKLIRSFAGIMHQQENDLKKWVHIAFVCSLLQEVGKLPMELHEEIDYMRGFVSRNYSSVLTASFRGGNIFYLDTISYRFGFEVKS